MWAGLAALGLVLGLAFWMTHPPATEASTTLLLTVGPEGQPGTAILNDQAIAQSRGVAAIALRELKLPGSIDSLLATYKSTVVTDRVLRITVRAPSSGEAVRRANAIASAFLSFRAGQLRVQQKLQFAALDDVLTQSEQRIAALDARIRQLAAQFPSDSQQAQLTSLRATRERAVGELGVLRNQVNTAKATAQETTAEMVGQSKVLDQASPVPHSSLKPLVLFGGAGLVLGLFLGVGLVLVRALTSDRLRQRDDVAMALGAPVKLSISTKPASRWRPDLRRRAARGSDVSRIVAHLRAVLPGGPRCRALAVVPVDDTRVAALSVVSLAESLAQHDARVVVADLCEGAPAARLLGVQGVGVHPAQVAGAQLDVAIPDPGEIAPIGPFTAPPATNGEPAVTSEVADACSAADVLLTLATLDPSLAGDHLQTWAADAVVVVTAGRSSWTRIHGVGEMLRLAGIRMVSAVLVGADKWDETLGVRLTRPSGPDTTPAADRSGADAEPADHPSVSRFSRK